MKQTSCVVVHKWRNSKSAVNVTLRELCLMCVFCVVCNPFIHMSGVLNRPKWPSGHRLLLVQKRSQADCTCMHVSIFRDFSGRFLLKAASWKRGGYLFIFNCWRQNHRWDLLWGQNIKWTKFCLSVGLFVIIIYIIICFWYNLNWYLMSYLNIFHNSGD